MKRFFPFLILLAVALGFFYQSVIFGKIPFPGDLLVSEYAPWKYEVFLGFNPGSFPNKAQYFDVLQQLYPWRQLAISEILQGRFPLWNPYSFSGYPLFANIQSAVLNPVNILFFILPFSYSWTLTVLLQCLLTSLGTHLFLKKLGFSLLPSLLGSFAYSYSLFMTVFLEYNTLGYVVMLLPFCAYSCILCREKWTGLRFISFTILLALLFFVGHLQLAVVAYVFLLVFSIVFSNKKKSSTTTILSILPFVFSILIASIQLLPAFELITFSARVPQDYDFLSTKLLIQPWQLIMVAIPDIFGNPATRNFMPNQTYPTKALSVGIVTLLFAFLAIWRLRKKSEVLFFSVASCIILLLVTFNPLSMLFYKIKIPLFATSSPSNMIFLLSFCLSILASYGLDLWLVKRVEKKTALLFLGMILILFLMALPQRIYFQEKNILFSLLFVLAATMLFLLGVLKQQWKEKIAGILLSFLIFELFFFFQKFNPFVSPSAMYPETSIIGKLKELASSGERIWGFGNAALEPNLSVSFRLHSPEGYDPLYPAYYGQLLAASHEGTIPEAFTAETRSNARIASLSGDDTNRLRLLDILSVRYVLDRIENGSSEKVFPADRFFPVYKAGGWTIFDNKKALPKAWLASSYVITPSTKAFQEQFFDKDFPYSQKVTVAEDPGVTTTMRKGQVVEFLSFPDRMLYKASTDGIAIFVLSQTHYPGWHVFVNGKEERLLRVDHALSGVVVPRGESDVAFYYWPQSFVFGSALTIISSVSLLLTVLFMRRREI